ncbi:hypothetical protein [Breznakiella homolactica]|uniref:BIG2 domain-containing protein n=1 Tax=Breznakiella homolactica TaxID=2798577 RepID=A0A7T7XRJ1_9SPIR|nr:hypothetical protein [Breznakiella homolactica]QQO11083.1 hypothetical protein JFL75_09245 [Breznakiella homolactica]
MNQPVYGRFKKSIVAVLSIILSIFCFWSCSNPSSSQEPDPDLVTVSQVAVTPGTANVEKGTSKTFSAAVTGTNNPAQTVAWSLVGTHHAQTAIGPDGTLSVAAGETQLLLTVKATSTVDTTKSATAQIKVRRDGVYFTVYSETRDYRVYRGDHAYQYDQSVEAWEVLSGTDIVVAYKWGKIVTCESGYTVVDGGFAKGRLTTNIDDFAMDVSPIRAYSGSNDYYISGGDSYRKNPLEEDEWQVGYKSKITVTRRTGQITSCITGWTLIDSSAFGPTNGMTGEMNIDVAARTFNP